MMQMLLHVLPPFFIFFFLLVLFFFLVLKVKPSSTEPKIKDVAPSLATTLPKAYPLIGSYLAIKANAHRHIQWLSDMVLLSPAATFTLCCPWAAYKSSPPTPPLYNTSSRPNSLFTKKASSISKRSPISSMPRSSSPMARIGSSRGKLPATNSTPNRSASLWRTSWMLNSPTASSPFSLPLPQHHPNNK